MKKTLLFSTLLFLTHWASAQVDLGSSTDITGADYYCADQGGMYAINLKDNRVWQADVGETTGLELSEVTIISNKNATKTIINGKLMNVVDVKLKLSKSKKRGVKLSGTFEQDGESIRIKTRKCSDKNEIVK